MSQHVVGLPPERVRRGHRGGEVHRSPRQVGVEVTWRGSKLRHLGVLPRGGEVRVPALQRPAGVRDGRDGAVRGLRGGLPTPGDGGDERLEPRAQSVSPRRLLSYHVGSPPGGGDGRRRGQLGHARDHDVGAQVRGGGGDARARLRRPRALREYPIRLGYNFQDGSHPLAAEPNLRLARLGIRGGKLCRHLAKPRQQRVRGDRVRPDRRVGLRGVNGATDRGGRPGGSPPGKRRFFSRIFVTRPRFGALGHRSHRRLHPLFGSLRVPSQRETHGECGRRGVHDLHRRPGLEGLPGRRRRARHSWEPPHRGWKAERRAAFQKEPAVPPARDSLRDEPRQLTRHPALGGWVLSVVAGPGGCGESRA